MKLILNKKLTFTIAFLLMLSTIFYGCYDKSELNENALVIGIGIDKVSGSNPILLTLELANPKADSGENGASGNQNTSIIETSSGKTLFDALQNFSKTTSLVMDFSHIKIIVISKSMCETGVTEILDYVTRNRQFRYTNWVLVANKTAEEAIRSKISNQDITSLGLAYMMNKLKKDTYILPVNLNKFLTDLEGQSRASFVPIIDVEKSKDLPQGKIKIEKSAIFKNDRLVGELSTEESKNLLWLYKKIKGSTVIFPIETSDSNSTITVQVQNKSIKIIPHITEDRYYFEIQCTGTEEIKEDSSIALNTEKIKEIESSTEKILKNKISRIIDKCQHEFNADILGFSESIYNNDPETWLRIKDDWYEIFPDVKYEVNFKINLNKVGMIKNPPTLNKEEEKIK